MAKIGEQIAALPMRWDKDGNLQVLMVTSRGTGRWVMPKGWEMDGKKPWAAAEIEALEEAGAKGYIGQTKVGTYRYKKVGSDGKRLECKVRVYPMIVDKLKRNWKERHERKRHWFSPKAAAKRVNEPELAALLMALHREPNTASMMRDWFDQAS